ARICIFLNVHSVEFGGEWLFIKKGICECYSPPNHW
uniref:Peptidase_M14 domain-containing protein n=1 Tax=Strongyloides papillosus TaxID=174720 RepID=A0A0N5BGR1_STREA